MTRLLVDGLVYGLQQHGGISRYFTEVLTRLDPFCHNIEVVLHLPANCRAKTPKARWIRTVKDWNLKPQRIFGGMCRGVGERVTRMTRPRIFHSTYYTLPYWPRLKSVVTVHDFIHERLPSLLPNSHAFVEMKKRVIESADVIVAVSNTTRNDVLNYTKTDNSRIRVIHHGISDIFLAGSSSEKDVRLFKETQGITGPYWLFLGKRGLYKNFGTFLRAFIKVARKTDGHLVAIGGEAKLEPYEVDMLIKHRLEHRLHLLQGLDDTDLRVVYSGAAAFVFPALAEGFGIPSLEAMACGTPVLLSDIPEFREVADDAALYFNASDEDELGEVLLRVLELPERQSLIEKGNRRVREFSWDVSAKKLADIYKSLDC